MDGWIVAVMMRGAANGKAHALIFIVGADDRSSAEKAVQDTVIGTVEAMEAYMMPPQAAMAFNVQPGDVRHLTQ